MMNYYTYMHTRNDTNEVFYIGKGKNQRAYSFDKRNAYWQNIVNKHGHTVHILAYWPTEQEAYDHEELLISCFRKLSSCLTNICDNNRPPLCRGEKNGNWGKCGELNHLYGRKRPSHGIRMAGGNNPFFGKKHKEETKQAHSRIMKGRMVGEKNPNYGNHMILTCPHCNKTGGRMMLRWHFDNCREMGTEKDAK